MFSTHAVSTIMEASAEERLISVGVDGASQIAGNIISGKRGCLHQSQMIFGKSENSIDIF